MKSAPAETGVPRDRWYSPVLPRLQSRGTAHSVRAFKWSIATATPVRSAGGDQSARRGLQRPEHVLGHLQRPSGGREGVAASRPGRQARRADRAGLGGRRHARPSGARPPTSARERSGAALQAGPACNGDAREGAVNLVRVAVSAPARTSCTLQITAEHFEKPFRSDRLGSVVWNWRAPVRAPKGVWTFAATCSEGARWARYWFQAEMGFPERSGALVAAPPVGTPAASSDSCDSQGVCFASDPFPVGQCTWYAAGRRPDLIGIVHGDAWEWLGAASGRVPEGSRPAVGAIAVFAPGAPGGTGHVAYVAAISGSRVLLDDSNWRPTPWSPWLEVHEHWEPASSASGYIYGGPVSSAP